MSRRNHRPPTFQIKDKPQAGHPPPVHEPHFGRGRGQMPHPALIEEMRESQFGMGSRGPLHPHPAIIEEQLAAQHQEIQVLLVDNQRLAATHVALKQELEANQHEFQRIAHFADSFQVEKDNLLGELYEKSLKLEEDIRGVESMKTELHQVHTDLKELSAERQDLKGREHAMTQDLSKITADLQQAPAMKSEIENMKQELQRARAAIEYEQKVYAENYEQGQVMENKLISMVRELEKLRTEILNAEKRAHPAVAVGNPGAGYNTNYRIPETGYAGNPYPVGYGMKPVQAGAESYPQYGPGPVSWGAYNRQGAQGHR